MKNSRKGSYLMEAAIILPMIMLTVITVVLICMFFFMQVREQCEMHVALRASAGALTEKTIYENENGWDGNIQISKSALGGRIDSHDVVTMTHRGLLHVQGTCELQGHAYATDGVKYVRYCSLVKGVIHDEE